MGELLFVIEDLGATIVGEATVSELASMLMTTLRQYVEVGGKTLVKDVSPVLMFATRDKDGFMENNIIKIEGLL